MRAVADRVTRTFASMDACGSAGKTWRGARQSAILLRVDVQLHDPSVVAADLGLSTRQFHRERRLAHDRFLDVYRAVDFALPQIQLDQDFATRLLSSAAGLADSGETSSARAILDDIARSGGDDAARCEAFSRLAEIEASTHRLDAARVNLAAASSVLAAAALPADERRRLQDMHNAVELCLRWFADGPTAVNRDRADCVAAGSTGSSGGVRAILVRAAAFIRSGESGRAAQLLHRFGQDAAANGAEAAVDLLTLRAELADFNAEDPHVSEHFSRARSILPARTVSADGSSMPSINSSRRVGCIRGTRPIEMRIVVWSIAPTAAYRRVCDRRWLFVAPISRSRSDIHNVPFGRPKRRARSRRTPTNGCRPGDWLRARFFGWAA